MYVWVFAGSVSFRSLENSCVTRPNSLNVPAIQWYHCPAFLFPSITLCSHCWWVDNSVYLSVVDWWVVVFFHRENAAFDCVLEVLLFSPYWFLCMVLMVCCQEVLQHLGGFGKPVLLRIYPRLHYVTAALYNGTVLIALYSTSTTGVLVLRSCWYVVVFVLLCMLPLS